MTKLYVFHSRINTQKPKGQAWTQDGARRPGKPKRIASDQAWMFAQRVEDSLSARCAFTPDGDHHQFTSHLESPWPPSR